MNALIRSALLIGSIYGIRKAAKSIGEIDMDNTLNQALGYVGLERRHSWLGSILPSIGLVAAGALVGAGTALLLAPSSGAALRTRLSDGVDDVKNRLEETVEKGRSMVGNAHAAQHS